MTRFMFGLTEQQQRIVEYEVRRSPAIKTQADVDVERS
jgi:hypothetical protein